jgi:hypothetical protein
MGSKIYLSLGCFIVVTVALLEPGNAHAQRRQARMAVYHLGTGTDSDRETAKTQATDDAEAGLICLGRLDDVRTTVSCAKMGSDENPQWLCTANSTGVCILGG